MSATIHFYIRSERPHSDNSAQVFMLFIINSKLKAKISLHKRIPIRKEFTKLKPEEIGKFEASIRNDMFCWDSQKERATNQAPSASKINQFIDAEKKRANDIVLKYQLIGKPLTVDIFKKLFCKEAGNKLFSEYFIEEFNNQSNRWAEETLRSYKSIVTKIQKFRPSLTLNDVDHRFLMEYENYMLKPVSEKGCGNCPKTVANNMKILRTLVLIATKNGDLLKDNYAFTDYRISDSSTELTTRDYLEPDEIIKLENLFNNFVAITKPIKTVTHAEWKEREEKGIITPGEHKALRRFLFSCYTGLRFRDMLLINPKKHIFYKDIEIPGSGERLKRYYIELKMHKTQNTVVIPLVDKALKIIDLNSEAELFENISNQKINEHLKSIQKKVKINKHFTFHVSRHSFATICFLYGLPEKVGQKLLGHKNRKFTEIYTHLSSHKLFLEMDKVNVGMNKINKADISTNSEEEAKMLELMPFLKNLNNEKMEQLKGIIRFLGT